MEAISDRTKTSESLLERIQNKLPFEREKIDGRSTNYERRNYYVWRRMIDFVVYDSFSFSRLHLIPTLLPSPFFNPTQVPSLSILRISYRTTVLFLVLFSCAACGSLSGLAFSTAGYTLVAGQGVDIWVARALHHVALSRAIGGKFFLACSTE